MILHCWKCLEAFTKVNDGELHLHSGISVNWLMIRVMMCLTRMHKNCRKYCALLSFAEFEVLSLLSDSFSFPPASRSLLAFVAALQPGAWKLPVTFVTRWSLQGRLTAQEVDNAGNLTLALETLSSVT